MDYREFRDKQLENPEIKKEYDALEEEYSLRNAIIYARNATHMSQQELARRSGINQADISKIENGNANPSFRTLSRIAEGLGMVLRITFEPISSVQGNPLI